jgi:hypothetical protein
MRLRLSLAINYSSEGKGVAMSDWIERMKIQDEKQDSEKQLQDSLRLHNARIIRAKGGSLWDAVVEQIRADSEKLKTAFPHDSTRQCELIARGDTHTLTSRKLPFKIMEMTLNLDGLCVDIQEASKHDRFDQSILSPKDPIKFVVLEHEEVEFEWKGSRYRQPSALAEYLIRYVCGMR